MMKKAFTSLVLALALQLSKAATLAKSTFSCAKTTSDVALQLRVTNKGPDAVSSGKKVYYFYTTSATGAPIYGTYTLDRKVKKGETFVITINPAWQTLVYSCGVSLKPYRNQNALKRADKLLSGV